VLERFKEGLARTRGKLGDALSLATAGEEPDWERLEEALLAADVGVAAMTDLIEAVRARRGDGNVREALRREILALLGASGSDDAFSSRESP